MEKGAWHLECAKQGIKKVEGLLTVCGDLRLNYAVPRGQEKERKKKYTGIFTGYLRDKLSGRKGTSYQFLIFVLKVLSALLNPGVYKVCWCCHYQTSDLLGSFSLDTYLYMYNTSQRLYIQIQHVHRRGKKTKIQNIPGGHSMSKCSKRG